MNAPITARAMVELIGTFLLALTIQLMVLHVPDELSPVAPMAIALVLVALVYAGGPVSGAVYNPAVLLAFVLAKGLPRRDIAPYLGAQIIGAALAAGAALFLRGPAITQIVPSPGMAIFAEALFTFALVWVILQVSNPRQGSNPGYGLAIGFIVGAGAYAVGAASGAAFNPAVWISLACTGKLAWSTWWLYLIGEGLGVLLAVGCYFVIEQEPDP
ncbi:MAG: aquaporin [Phycisphaerales bacterium]|nr:aquaporin [Phycisphaerales bacterium]